MRYAERPSAVPGAVVWTKAGDPAPARILPDGCLDLIWDGSRLFVAGPDLTARWHTNPGSAGYAALRFSHGVGPAMLGVPAEVLLHRRSLALFGYGPRHLVRVLRMSRALEHARTGTSLAQVAAASGYADQAHLTRDVRELAGTTPTRLLRELAR